MLVFYSGDGQWHVNDCSSDNMHEIVNGIFELPPENEREIIYTGKTFTKKLLQCDFHEYGVKYDSNRTAQLVKDLSGFEQSKKILQGLNELYYKPIQYDEDGNIISTGIEYLKEQVDKWNISDVSNKSHSNKNNVVNSKLTSSIDINRLECLKKLIKRWEVEHKYAFEIDSSYNKAKRKIIPISSNIMLKALKKEFNNRNVNKLAALKLENTSFWKSPERKDICILSKTNSRDTDLENKII